MQQQQQQQYINEHGQIYILDKNGQPQFLNNNQPQKYIDQNGKVYTLNQKGEAIYETQTPEPINEKTINFNRFNQKFHLDKNNYCVYFMKPTEGHPLYYFDQHGVIYYEDKGMVVLTNLKKNEIKQDPVYNPHFGDVQKFRCQFNPNVGFYHLNQNGKVVVFKTPRSAGGCLFDCFCCCLSFCAAMGGNK
jgi:hypothetical protein